jgi:hypothetical protein
MTGTGYFSTDVISTDVFVETKFSTVFSGSALMFDTLIFETFTFSISTVISSLCFGDTVTGSMSGTFNVKAFTFVFTTFLENIKGRVWWTVRVVSTLNGATLVIFTSFEFATFIVTNTVDLFTFVGLGITDMGFSIYIEWNAVFVGSAFNSFTFVLKTDLLVTAEFTSTTFNFDTLWVSVIGLSVTDFSFLEFCTSDWVTGITVSLLLTVNWLTCIGTFLDLVGIIGVGDDDAVRETFVWGIVTIAVVMGVTFLFNTFVIMAIVLVWAVFRLDTLLWFTHVLLTKTFTSFAFFVGVKFASIMRSTINFFTEILSWVFFVDFFTEMIFTAIVIVFTSNWFTRVVDTSFGVSAVIVSLAVDWVTGVLLTFIFFFFVVTEMWSLVCVLWKVVAVKSVFTFDFDTSFLFTFHTGSTMFVSVTCSFHLISDFVENLDDALVLETETTFFVAWFGTVSVFFAFFCNAFSLFTFTCSRFTFFASSGEFVFAVLCVTAFK